MVIEVSLFSAELNPHYHQWGSKMTKIEVQLDEQTLAHAIKLAKSRHCTLDELIKEIIENLETFQTANESFVGMFSDEPELIDQIMEAVMMTRETHPLRQSN